MEYSHRGIIYKHKGLGVLTTLLLLIAAFHFSYGHEQASMLLLFLAVLVVFYLLLRRFKEVVVIYSSIYICIPSIYGLDLGYNVPYVSLTRILSGLIILFGLVKGYYDIRRLRQNPMMLWFGLLFSVFTISVLGSERIGLSINTLVGITAEWLLLSVLVFEIMTGEAELGMFLRGFMAMFIIVWLLALFEFLMEVNLIYSNYIPRSDFGYRLLFYDYSDNLALASRLGFRRIQSVFNHPYYMSNYGIIAFFLFMSKYFQSRERKYILLSGSSLGLICLAFSRVSILSFLIGLIVFILANNRRRLRRVTLVLVALVAGVLAISLIPNIEELSVLFSRDSLFDYKYGSTIMGRVEMLENGINLLKGKLILGYGLQIPSYYLFVDRSWLFERIGFLEISWLYWALSVGIAGVAAMWAVYYKFIRLSMASLKKELNYVSLAFVAILAGAFVNDMVGTQTFYSFLFVLGGISIKNMK